MLNDHEVRARLAAARLVTVGRPVPGARGLARRVHEVDLSGLDDPRLVPHAVIRALGVSVRPDLAPLDAIAAGLRGPALLVLGPCDRVLAGCARTVAGLLERCPELSVLAISGVPLGVPGEIPVN
ncbi:MAG: hypothetical protein HOY71_14840 [Nonomuraea sp.]|nr:hypothetical protein [Nonomuraea sp.]